jgi:hypothetical protein
MDSVSGLFKSAKTLAPLTASIRLMDPPTLLEHSHMRTHLVPDLLHPPLPVFFDHGSHHVMYMDDKIMAAERDEILAVIHVSVLSAYVLYGFPDDDRRGTLLAEDKYEPFAHYHQEHLGLDINTRTVMVIWLI